MWLQCFSHEVVKSPSSPYLFIFIGFNLATIALVFTLNLSIPKNLLERLHSHYIDPKSNNIKDINEEKDRILNYFYWIDFVSFCWLISLVTSILNAATILLLDGQLGIIKRIWIVQLLLIFWAIIHCISLICTARKVYEQRNIIGLKIYLIILGIILFFITLPLIYFSCSFKFNHIIILFLFLFCLYLMLCLLQQYKLMPVTSLLVIWQFVDKSKVVKKELTNEKKTKEEEDMRKTNLEKNEN